MRWSSVVRSVGLAAGLAWAFGAAAQSGGAGGGAGSSGSSGTPVSQRPLEGRVVSVDPQDHSIMLDTTQRAHAVPDAAEADRTAPATADANARRHPHRAAAHERQAAWAGDVERATNAKLQLAPRGTVIRDGLNVPLDQVKPGDEVRAMFLTDDLTRTHPWKVEVRSPRGRDAPWGVETGG